MATYEEHRKSAAATRAEMRRRRVADVDVDPDVTLAAKPAVTQPCTFCDTPCVSDNPTVPMCRACLGGN